MMFYRGLSSNVREEDTIDMLTSGMKSSGLGNFGKGLRGKYLEKTGLDIKKAPIKELLECHRNAAPCINGKAGSYLMSFTTDKNMPLNDHARFLFQVIVPEERIADSEEEINERTVLAKDPDYEKCSEKEYTSVKPFLHPNFIHSVEDRERERHFINNEFGQTD
jgi:hypothetical protein